MVEKGVPSVEEAPDPPIGDTADDAVVLREVDRAAGVGAASERGDGEDAAEVLDGGRSQGRAVGGE